MSSPEPPSDDTNQDENTEQPIPPAAPSYSTPPPEGVPSADDRDAE